MCPIIIQHKKVSYFFVIFFVFVGKKNFYSKTLDTLILLLNALPNFSTYLTMIYNS